MGIVSWIVIGGFAGWIASMITGRNRQMGLLANIAVGVIGGLAGGWVMQLITGSSGITGFTLKSFLVALGGSVVLLFIYGLLTRGRRTA